MAIKPYRVEIPENYSELRDLGNRTHDTILARRVPQPDHIAKVLGGDSVKPNYLMHALLWAIEHKRGTGIPEYKRRDRKAIQRHSYDAAFKPFYRFQDKNLPSRFFLTERENRGILVHDLAEEFGQSLLGALVVNDTIGYLLGETAGKDADLLTNKNALLLNSIEEEVNKLHPLIVDHANVYGTVQKLRSEVKVEQHDVLRQYRRVLQAIRSFRDYVDGRVDYMPDLQKKALLGVIDELSGGVSGKMRGGILEARLAADHHVNQYGNVMSVMDSRGYDEVDKNIVRLVSSEDPEFLLTLKKTLYRDNIRRIAGAVKKDVASGNGQPQDDSYTSPFMEKLADSTDTAANMDFDLSHATSIFRKERIVIETGVELVDSLRQSGLEHQRLQRSVEYLFGNLYDSVNQYLDFLEGKVLTENTLAPNRDVFRIMKEKMGPLERLVDSMEGSSWFTETLRSGMRIWEGLGTRLREAKLI